MLEAHRRDILLEAIARSAKELLRTSDMTRSIPKVLEHIGHATNVDRVHMLAVDPAGQSTRVVSSVTACGVQRAYRRLPSSMMHEA